LEQVALAGQFERLQLLVDLAEEGDSLLLEFVQVLLNVLAVFGEFLLHYLLLLVVETHLPNLFPRYL
jgi:hypothetical protein